jgi:hypothetical protein
MTWIVGSRRSRRPSRREGVDPDLYLEKGGDDDDSQLRLRAGLFMPADAGLPVLTGH